MNVLYQEVPWGAGVWTNEPAEVKIEDGRLNVTAVHESDYWEKTLYGFQHRDGHALLTDLKRTEAMEVTFLLEDFQELYDQAGMMLWYAEYFNCSNGCLLRLLELSGTVLGWKTCDIPRVSV